MLSISIPGKSIGVLLLLNLIFLGPLYIILDLIAQGGNYALYCVILNLIPLRTFILQRIIQRIQIGQ